MRSTELEPRIALSDDQYHSFSFTGSASEYFRVWTVNVLLTIVTLGFYGPWAKVRKQRYLFANTWVAHSNFDYHADPRMILRGRLIALSAFVAYTGFGLLAPRLATITLLVASPLVPLLVLRALTFAAVNSSFRNLRFGFQGRYCDVARALGPLLLMAFVARPTSTESAAAAHATLIMPWLRLATMLALPCAYPYMVGWRWRLRLNGMSYGTEALACGATMRDFYLIYGRAILLVLGGAVVATAVNLIVLPALMLAAPGSLAVAASVPYLLLWPLAVAYTRAEVTNAALGATRVGQRVRLVSQLAPVPLASLYLTNTLALALSCGLMAPWAVVRTARYRSSTVQLVTTGDLDDFRSRVVGDVSATGAEATAIFDFDFAL